MRPIPARWRLVLLCFVTVSCVGGTNDWTKTSSGAWEEPYWSLGQIPGRGQGTIALRNGGWKAVAINAATRESFPESLMMDRLLIESPADSFNVLLLNYAGLEVPVTIDSELVLGANTSLISYYTALRGGSLLLSSSASFSEGSSVVFSNVLVGAQAMGELNLTNSYLTATTIQAVSGEIYQHGGRVAVSNIQQVAASPAYGGNGFAYYLASGTLISGGVSLGRYDFSWGGFFGYFEQSGGVHTNGSIGISGFQRHFREPHGLGSYRLSGGLLVADNIYVDFGGFGQTGGTNYVQALAIRDAGSYGLSGGELICSNASIGTVDCIRTGFSQSGGRVTVLNHLGLESWAIYSLSDGILIAPWIEVGPAARLGLTGGMVANPGIIVLRDGILRAEVAPQHFGKLVVLDDFAYNCSSSETAPPYATIEADSTNGPTLLYFEDSWDAEWTGRLRIVGWSTNGAGLGPDHILFGNNTHGLNPNQLSRIVFVRPNGLPSEYRATITSGGKVVPSDSLYEYSAHIYNYSVANGTATITGIIGSGGSFNIPSIINGFPVVAVGAGAPLHPAMTNITIPGTVTSIGPYAFSSSAGLVNLVLPPALTNIGDYAFQNCTSVTNLALPASVAHIGTGAFQGCERLRTIVLPDNLTSLGTFAFQWCSSLTNVNIPSQTTMIPEGTFSGCISLGSMVIPDSVTAIGKNAFSSCISLTNVSMGAGVTNIDDFAFSFTRLSDIVLRGTDLSIGNWAFSHCTNLNRVDIQGGVASLGEYAFVDSGLTNITLGTGLRVIKEGTFFGCTNLPGITIPPGVTEIGYLAFRGCCGLTTIAIPGSVTTIGDSAFSYSGLVGVVIPDGVVSIGAQAFQWCTNLSSVVVSGTVKTIGSYAFANTPLRELLLEEGVATIGNGAFVECIWLSTLTIPNSVINIGSNSFSGCSGLSAIIVESGNPSFSSLEGVLFNKPKTTLLVYPATKSGSYRIPATVTNLADEAFYGCSGLASVDIPMGVLRIGNDAFAMCTALETLTIPDSVSWVGDAFWYCTNLTNVHLGSGVASLGPATFYYTPSLEFISVDPGNPVYGSDLGVLWDKQRWVLMQCPARKPGRYVVPSGITEIGRFAFEGCTNLTSVVVPDSVTNIIEYAFAWCLSLTNVTIGNGLVNLDNGAFQNCENLTSITLPSSLKELGLWPFFNCFSLTAAYFRGDAPSITGQTWNGAPVTVYYLPGTTGWGATCDGAPTASWFLPEPVILPFGQSFGVRANQFGFVISWATNAAVAVEACANLAAGPWISLRTNTLEQGSTYFTDPNWTNYPARYYRVRKL